MIKNNIAKIMFSVLFLILLSLSAFAVQEDFSLYTTKFTDNICAGDIIENSFILENRGIVTSTYHVELSGSGAQFAAISENFAILETGESKELILFLNPQKDIEGEFPLTVTISTDFDTVKTYDFTVNIKNCNNIVVEMPYDSFASTPCMPTQYQFKVYNPGVYNEEYTFSVDGFENTEVAFNYRTILVTPGDTQDVIMYVTPQCEKYGVYQGTLNVRALGSNHAAQEDFVIKVKRTYDYDIENGIFNAEEITFFNTTTNTTETKIEKNAFFTGVPDPYPVCSDLVYRIPVKISNNMYFSNIYDLELDYDSSDFRKVEISDTEVYVPAHQSKIIELMVYPKQPGNYNITVNSVSRRGQAVRNSTVSLDVEKCYDFDIKVQGLSKETCELYNQFNIKLENKGTKDITLNLNFTDNLFVTNKTVDLAFNETKTIIGKLLPGNISAEHEQMDIGIRAKEADFPMFNKVLHASVDYYSNEKCFDLDFVGDSFTVFYENISKSFDIIHTGVREAEYDITLEAPDWVSLSESNITLIEGTRKTLYPYFTPGTDVPEGLYNATITFTMPLSGETYKHVLKLNLRHPTEVEKAFMWANENKLWLILIFVMLIVVIFLFIIAFKPSKRAIERRMKERKEAAKKAKAEKRKAEIEKRKAERERKKAERKKALAAKKAEKKVAKPKKKPSKKPKARKPAKFPIWLTILLILLVLLGLVWLVYNYVQPFVSGYIDDLSNTTSNTTTTIGNATTTLAAVTTTTAANQSATTTTEETTTTLAETTTTMEPTTTTEEVTTTTEQPSTTTTTIDITSLSTEDAAAYAQEMGDEYIFLDYIAKKGIGNSVVFQIWDVNTNHSMDLKDYFYDPDDDILLFTFTEPENIGVQVNEGLAAFAPKQDWHGVETISFKAEDNKGGQAVSPTIYLIVKDKKAESSFDFIQFLKDYTWWIVNAFLVLLIVILIIVPKPKKK